LAFVHPGSAIHAQVIEDHGLGDVPRVDDPAGTLYRAFGLARGTLGQLAGPAVWRRGLQALFAGHRVGHAGGDVLRLPGVFLLRDGEVRQAYRQRNSADRPDYVALAMMEK
jgi:hypothetical protein